MRSTARYAFTDCPPCGIRAGAAIVFASVARCQRLHSRPGISRYGALVDLGRPAWLAQVVTALFDGQEPAAARDWAARIHADLVRLDGRVPFAVVHDWHADTV